MLLAVAESSPNPSRQYSKRQTRGEEIEKCLDEGLEPTYHFSIFNLKVLYRFVECLICQKAFSDQLHLQRYQDHLYCMKKCQIFHVDGIKFSFESPAYLLTSVLAA